VCGTMHFYLSNGYFGTDMDIRIARYRYEPKKHRK